MAKASSSNNKSTCFIDQQYHQMFIEDVVIPCLDFVSIQAAYPGPLSFNNAARNGLGHSSVKLEAFSLSLLVGAIRELINSGENTRLNVFKDFFFVISSHGMKKVISDSIYQQDFSGLGGFKYMEPNHSYVSVQAYGVWKHAFFRREYQSNRQGMDLTPNNILDKAKAYENWMKHHSAYLQCIGSRQYGYGARLEFRLNCTDAPEYSLAVNNVNRLQRRPSLKQ
ncbi:hypothetical protein BDF20DRAFT_913995 [Mycotypha africana]|uniref:uncharacterized protein n=1 Tax=Mycotypha africana TaxID=64632 RepID=UPI0022FFE6B1|nr:uncharacterized protein BDF20DRAFT_913995 [Mycotypha africana]KAI8977691.1 hypothetical protein BDF20DRAFT_913995 [Mycotypha africana]